MSEQTGNEEFPALADLLKTLGQLTNPEEVLALRPSASLQQRIEHLLEKSRSEGLAPEEQREWQQYEHAEHVVRMAKARAALNVKGI